MAAISDNNEIMDNILASAETHLNMVQGVIERMSSNCASCKTWCITLVSAILALFSDQNEPSLFIVAFVPIVLFFFLDTYYLSLEKRFRNHHDEFIEKLHKNKLEKDDLFSITPKGKAASVYFQSIKSPSIWVFYAMFMFIVILVYFLMSLPA